MIQKKEIEYCKEIDDVAVLLNHLVKNIRAGKSISDLTTGSLAPLMEAVSGVNDVPEEIKANRKVALQTLGYRSGELADALLG